ncbi:MAG: metal ABC transporter permease [Candidatus Thermoplasmatota archaeon]|nr:metal ABC transporter permease [Candidatus Thermoplasmatota archaeon]
MLDLVDYLDVPFVQRMLIAGILASLACGVIGTLVVVRRNVFMAGGISHSSFGGIGFAYYMQHLGLTWFDPMLGAVLFATGAALLLGSEPIKRRYREDSTIGALWVIGMAVGVLLINLVDRNNIRVLSFEAILFGNILLTSTSDLVVIGAILCIIYIFILFLFKDTEILAFDEEFARISGINVTVLNTAILIMIALTVTILIKIVGVVLVLAMLTIPAAISNLFTKRLSMMMLASSGLGVIITTAGNLISIELDTPPGATIVILMGAAYLLSLMGKSIYTRVLSIIRIE